MVIEDKERAKSLSKALAELDDELLTPALIVDLDAVEHNIDAIIRKIGDVRRWRPHVKTVKQSKIVRAMMGRGVSSFKCATLEELALVLDVAERVHPEGEVDAFIAYPLTRNGMRGVVELANDYEGATIRLLADSPEHLHALQDWAGSSRPPRRLDVLLDVDVGMQRTGVAADVWSAASDVGDSEHLRLVGLHGYEGHIGWSERADAQRGYDALVELGSKLARADLIVTSGTHAFLHALGHEGLGAGSWRHQVSPGTIVLSDLRSREPAKALGLRQAVFVGSRVVARPGTDRVTLDAGSKALSPDRPAPGCEILGWPQLEAMESSEEHRPVLARDGRRPGLGELLWLVPDHACTTVNMHRHVVFVRGDRLEGTGTVEAMSRTLLLRQRRI